MFSASSARFRVGLNHINQPNEHILNVRNVRAQIRLPAAAGRNKELLIRYDVEKEAPHRHSQAHQRRQEGALRILQLVLVRHEELVAMVVKQGV